MRRFLALALTTMAAPLVVATPSAQAAEAPAVVAHAQDYAPQRACLASAQAEGASAEAAARGCLNPADWTITPFTATGATAEDVFSCAQAAQRPYKYTIGVISWGTLIVCNAPFVAVASGTLSVNGVPVDAQAGPTIIPASSIQFWTTFSPCVLSGYYHTSIILALAVGTTPGATVVPADSSGSNLIGCP